MLSTPRCPSDLAVLDQLPRPYPRGGRRWGRNIGGKHYVLEDRWKRLVAFYFFLVGGGLLRRTLWNTGVCRHIASRTVAGGCFSRTLPELLHYSSFDYPLRRDHESGFEMRLTLVLVMALSRHHHATRGQVSQSSFSKTSPRLCNGTWPLCICVYECPIGLMRIVF